MAVAQKMTAKIVINNFFIFLSITVFFNIRLRLCFYNEHNFKRYRKVYESKKGVVHYEN